MKLKPVSLLVGAIVASSLSTPTKYVAGSTANAADAIRPVTRDAVRVPEFVPVVNFSEFVLATEQFAAENRPTARDAAEALSAKFALASDAQRIELHGAQPQQTPAIVTSALSIPVVPDPSERPTGHLADPVKIVTVVPDTLPVAPQPRRVEKKIAPVDRADIGNIFQPVMGLGMATEHEEDVTPPPSSLAPSKKKSASHTVNRRVASTEPPPAIRAPDIVTSTNPVKPANKDGVVNQDLQIGVPGQSMEPLVSTCAKVERNCTGKFFCGC